MDIINFLNIKDEKQKNFSHIRSNQTDSHLKKFQIEEALDLEIIGEGKSENEMYTQILFLESFDLEKVNYKEEEPHPFLQKYLCNYDNIPSDLYHEWIDCISSNKEELLKKLFSIDLYNDIPKLTQSKRDLQT